MVAVLMSVLTIRMIMQSSEDYGATGAAACCRAKCIIKSGAILCQRIKMWCLNGGVPVASRIPALVIHYKHDNVAREFDIFLSTQGKRQQEQQKTSVFNC